MNQRRISTDNTNAFLLGFDELLNHAFNKTSASNYPPHNIYKLSKDDPYSDMIIEVAVAGIPKEDISIVLTNEDTLKVEYNGTDDNYNDFAFIHKGIASRKFSLEWKMNKDLEVEEASCNNGMLRIKIANHANLKGSMQKINIK